jgi:uncharacterized protein YhfF
MAEAPDRSDALSGPAPAPLDEGELRRRELEAARASARALQAADDVRRDIGRHLHDRVQTLAIAARQQLYAGRQALGAGAAAADAPLAAVDDLLGELVGELADLARGLHPVGLEAGLRPALDALAERAPVPLVVLELPDHPLGGPVETTVHTMVSEAINNAVKHAGATRVRVRVRAGATALTVVVDDDGAGGADARGGSGLLGIRDRVTLLGGTLAVESPGGGGTTLRATIPLAPERLPHRQFLLVGHPDDPEVADRAVEAIRSGRKRAGLSLAREWELEGGPPGLGQLVPVIDVRGATRLTLEVTGLSLTRLPEMSAEEFAACAIAGASQDERRELVRRNFAGYRAEHAVLFGEPDWALTDDEPLIVLRHRVVSDAG